MFKLWPGLPDWVLSLLLDRFVLKGFDADGRDLTDKETKAFLAAADKDGDGKIGIDGERTSTLKGTVPLKIKLYHYKTLCHILELEHTRTCQEW